MKFLVLYFLVLFLQSKRYKNSFTFVFFFLSFFLQQSLITYYKPLCSTGISDNSPYFFNIAFISFIGIIPLLL